MIDANENFNGTWPFKPNFFTGNGFKQHFIDEGKNNEKIIFFLHGEPTWGYVYREFIKKLSKEFLACKTKSIKDGTINKSKKITGGVKNIGGKLIKPFKKKD